MRLPVFEHTPRACSIHIVPDPPSRPGKGVKPRAGEVYRETTKLLATYAKVRLTPSSFRWICKSGTETSRRCSRCSSSLRADVKYASTMHRRFGVQMEEGIDIPGLSFACESGLVLVWGMWYTPHTRYRETIVLYWRGQCLLAARSAPQRIYVLFELLTISGSSFSC